MKRNFVYAGLVLATICIASLLPLQAHAAQCSQAAVAGSWAYTYNGTVFVPNPLPVAVVGHAHLDSSGNLAGSQTHTLAGQTEVEDLSGTYTVNKDCTGLYDPCPHVLLVVDSDPGSDADDGSVRTERLSQLSSLWTPTSNRTGH